MVDFAMCCQNLVHTDEKMVLPPTLARCVYTQFEKYVRGRS